MWAEVEWSPKRRAWCVQDAAGHCLTHVEHIVGQNIDASAAIRLAKRMIVFGEMPSPEEAHAQLRAEQERARPRAKNRKLERKQEHEPLGQLIIGDITARSEAVPVVRKASKWNRDMSHLNSDSKSRGTDRQFAEDTFPVFDCLIAIEYRNRSVHSMLPFVGQGGRGLFRAS